MCRIILMLKLTSNICYITMRCSEILILFSVMHSCSPIGVEHQDIVKLQSHLFQNYTTLARPVRNQSSRTTVWFSMGLFTIQSYKIQTGDIGVYGFCFLSWVDEFLSWNINDFGGADKLYVPGSMLWNPGLLLLYSRNPNVLQETLTDKQPILSNGHVNISTYGLMNTKCDTDISNYPFDEHLCMFRFVPGSYTTEEVFVESGGDMVTHLVVQNEEWELLYPQHRIVLEGVTGRSHSVIEFTFTIRRRPMFLFIHVFVPLLLIFWLNILTCFIPPDSGERVSFAAALFLSFTFVMASVSEDLPRNSLKISKFSLCLTFMNGLCVIGTGWSVLVIRLTNLGRDTTIPWIMKYLALSNFTRRKSKDNKNGLRRIMVSPAECMENDTATKARDEKIGTETEEGENVNYADSKIATAEEEITWHDVIRRLDKLYLVFVIIYLVAVTCAFILIST